MEKKQYVTPEIEVVKTTLENHLLDISIPIGSGGGPGGGGQAKSDPGFEDEQDDDKAGSSWHAWDD